jgi:hypothetical protein
MSPVNYFTTNQRRAALLRWMTRESVGPMSISEITKQAVDIFTPLYGVDDRQICARDLRKLVGEGHVENVGRGQYMVRRS